MKSWSETIKLSKPPRELRILGVPGTREAEMQERLEARYRQGRLDGERDLSARLAEQRQQAQQLFDGVVASLRQAVPQVIRDTENTLVALALAVAQKLVADVPISAAMIESAVRDALSQVEANAEFTVRLHREDLELLKSAHSPMLAETDQFRFVASADVTRGGCVVETHFGTIDGRRETRFELVKRSLSA